MTIVLLFSYFRLTIINARTVAFTYDRGRDFLAGARMITDKNLVFIGPTTGIGGLFHGVWWFYVTALSFLILGPDPISFYYSLFIIHLATLTIWFWVIRNRFDTLTAAWTSLLIASGSYYVSSHTFAGNNILAIPSFTLFCLALLSILRSSTADKKQTLFLGLLLGASTGFVAETELSFGLFLIPSLLTLAIASPILRSFFSSRHALVGFFAGIIVPFMPRLLFELKNGFMQTQVLLGFFTKPKLYNPRSYGEVFSERISIFSSYAEQALGSTYMVWLGIAAIITLAALLFHYRKARPLAHFSTPLHFAALLALLFTYCLVYRDPFWMNYYEGIQLGFLMLLITTLSSIKALNASAYKIALVVLCIPLTLIIFSRVTTTMQWKSGVEGLAIQEGAVDYIVQSQMKAGEKVFCARVYTPPVIPHTYDYLWLQHYTQGDVDTPRYDFVDNSCWYIIEREWDGFEFRLTEWKKNNIPEGSREQVSVTRKFNGTTVTKYLK